jgi:PIN domain nuclease of toxin-antitoxin system
MRVLLDSHAFLWFIWDDPGLSPAARAAIRDPGNVKYVSLATSWEVAIKVGQGKLQLGVPYRGFIPTQMALNRFDPLPIDDDHLAAVVDLPWHHKDPFDRMIVAQSLCENMPIVSVDAKLDIYGVVRIW